MNKKRTNFTVKFFDDNLETLSFSKSLQPHITRTSIINAWNAHQVVRKLELYIEEDVDNVVASSIDDLLEFQDSFNISIDCYSEDGLLQGGVVFFNCKPVEVVLNAFDNKFNSLIEQPVLGDFGSDNVTNRLTIQYETFKRKPKI